MQFLMRLGVIRSLFLILVVVVILGAPLALGGTNVESLFGILSTIMLPSMLPMFFFLLPMDMTMCRAIQDGQSEQVRRHYGKIIRLEAVLWLLMILAWIPFLLQLTK